MKQRLNNQTITWEKSDEEWLAVIKECQESDQTVRAWCEGHGIDYVMYNKMIRRLRYRYSDIPNKYDTVKNDKRWLAVIEECQESGQPTKLWCEEHGISYGSYKTTACELRKKGYDVGETRKRRNDKEWFGIVKEYQESGQSLKTWCRDHDITYKTFIGARSRLIQKGYADIEKWEDDYSRIQAERKDRKWLEIIRECQESGKSARQWCEEHNIPRGVYDYMCKQLRQKDYADTPEWHNILRRKRSKRRSAEEWVGVIKDCNASNQDEKVWCEEQGINWLTFKCTCKRLNRMGYLAPAESQTNPSVKGDKAGRSDEKWLEIIKQCQESGQPAKAWCVEHAINYTTYLTTLYRLRKRGCYEADLKGKYSGRSDEEWLEIIDECRKSSQSTKAWCKEHGISATTYYSKVSQLRKDGRYSVELKDQCQARSDKDWLEIIKECQKSNQSVSLWCREHGIPRTTYYSKALQLRQDDSCGADSKEMHK